VSTATEQTVTPTPTGKTPGEPRGAQAPDPTRLVNIGDLVWVGAQPTRIGGAAAVVVIPAIVVRVDRPSDPTTSLLLQVFGFRGVVAVEAVPFSPEPRVDHWTWPRPAPAPEPAS
jgi:hypothetical protein